MVKDTNPNRGGLFRAIMLVNTRVYYLFKIICSWSDANTVRIFLGADRVNMQRKKNLVTNIFDHHVPAAHHSANIANDVGGTF